MKIINKEEFMALPAGTLYSEYDPCIIDGLFVKGESLPADYIEMPIIGNIEAGNSDIESDIIDDAEQNGTSFNLDFEKYGRNGLFEDSQLYAVYEQKDIDGLIECLKKCKGHSA